MYSFYVLLVQLATFSRMLWWHHRIIVLEGGEVRSLWLQFYGWDSLESLYVERSAYGNPREFYVLRGPRCGVYPTDELTTQPSRKILYTHKPSVFKKLAIAWRASFLFYLYTARYGEDRR